VDLQNAIRHALDGKAVLFTGAGFSFGATNNDAKPLLSGRSLANKLLTEIGYKKPDGALEKAAAAYLRRKSEDDLVNLLVNAYTVREVTNTHAVLASLPWRRVYTTNYDNVFEEASRKIGKVCNSIDGVDEPRDHIAKPNLLIHINGTVTRLTKQRLHTTFKLVSESYAADSFQNSGWAFHFRNDIRTAAAVVFVGYSMYDLDVRRVLYSEDISNKCIFVIAPSTPENELDAEDLSDLGVVAPVGIDALASTVETIKRSYSPQEPELLLEEWEEVIPVQHVAAPPSDGEVLDFLIKGDASNSLLLEACGPNRENYVISRTSIANIESDLASNGARVLIVGDLGTGKTFICDCISQLFLARGWNVFKLDGGSENEIPEAEEICSFEGEKLLLVENYQRHMELLKWFADAKPHDVSLAITARSHIHELFAKELYELFGDQLRIRDVSQLDTHEVSSSVTVFNHYGLWGDRAAWSPQRKQQFVVHDCAKYLPSLLVDVLKSQHVTQRYKALLAQSGNRGDIGELLICAFALEVIGFAPRVFHIQELLANRVQWARLRVQAELKSIIDFEANFVRARSSVLGRHLLHEVFPAKTIVSTLIGMAKEADERRSARDFYQILNSLMRYRSVAAVLPDTNRLESTINLYEGVKNLSATRRNPQFWLQYAIACLAFGKLDRAERYFKDAYSLVYNGYNTYQIDNHYARLLLEKALVTQTANDAILLIDEARKIVLQQMRTEVRYYPYRVAISLFRCYERFADSWNPEQKAYFKRTFQEIRRCCESITGVLRNNRYVIECLERANQALSGT
jgi:hypothetical protein